MKQMRIYKYIGKNGSITSKVLLDIPNRIDKIELKADSGKILTNGYDKFYTVYVLEDEVNKWYEINDEQNNG